MKKHFLLLLCLLALCASAQEKPIKILSLNNSLIEYNDQAAMFNDIARAEGCDAQWSKRTQLGRSLLFHYNDEFARQLVASRPWDYIILQEQSSLPRNHPEILLESVKLWKKFILANCPNPDVRIILPVNWPYAGEWDVFEKNMTILNKSYAAVARDIPGVTLCPVGDAYALIYKKYGEKFTASLYTDDRHPSPLATYLAAIMEYAVITGTAPSQIKYVPKGIDAKDAATMRSIASEVLAK